MDNKILDGNTFRHMLLGGAEGIRDHIGEINDLNVFPVPDGDTGTNMSRTIDGGISHLPSGDAVTLAGVAESFARGSLFGARGNSGVILSQFFAGLCDVLADKTAVTAVELADACLAGVERSYSAVANPVEGTILTVIRESAEYAKASVTKDSTIEDFLLLNIEEAERSLSRTKEILPALIEADVVDSGGAGYLCIVRGVYDALCGKQIASTEVTEKAEPSAPNYELFTTDSVLTYGYCTECLVRLQRAKIKDAPPSGKTVADKLEALGCDSVVALCDGDILKVHAHTHTPSDVLTLCQIYGEFLNVKIENMSLQHSESAEAKPEKKKPHKRYGVVTVASGDGMRALFEQLGADVVIDGGQSGNPSAEEFLSAFEQLNADDILVLPNNGNILLTAMQAADLYGKGNVTVIETKTLPEGYAALTVFNASCESLEDVITDLLTAKDAVVSGEVTVAVRDSVVGGMSVRAGDSIGILDGDLITAKRTEEEALLDLLAHVEDMDEREIITLFVGREVTEAECARITEVLEEQYGEHTVECYIGGQEIYDYLIAVE